MACAPHLMLLTLVSLPVEAQNRVRPFQPQLHERAKLHTQHLEKKIYPWILSVLSHFDLYRRNATRLLLGLNGPEWDAAMITVTMKVSTPMRAHECSDRNRTLSFWEWYRVVYCCGCLEAESVNTIAGEYLAARKEAEERLGHFA